MEKGTTNGTITNFDGVYYITISEVATLVFRYIGMEKIDRKVVGAGVLNTIMNSS